MTYSKSHHLPDSGEMVGELSPVEGKRQQTRGDRRIYSR